MIHPHPKPAPNEPKARKWLKRTRVVTRRTKARRGRLKGNDLSKLRRQCFERDLYRCAVCGAGVSWDTGEMAHRGAKRRHGDSLPNVRTLCTDCHRREHAYGPSMTKPVPSKERAQ